MLKLNKMQIAGFKSFGDRTEVRFLDGITAVVGPNGCGKSNIGDAINWVLGEQSPKSLRGHKMKDVIFNGSKVRKPKGMAEVSLEMTGVNGSAASSQPVVITRRLFRSGESEYLLNGARTRLRDIQEVLHAEHVGAKTYATIEQGRIDQILNAKPKDRRGIIEDAAGISGFKHKRRLAQLKLEATQANLLRVNDVVTEVRRQINSIKRQASKARRYQRLRESLRELETLRYGLRAGSMDEELRRLRSVESDLRAGEAAAAADLATREAALTAARAALEEAEREFREASEALHRLDLEIDREESGIRRCREKIAESGDATERAAGGIRSLGGRREEVRGRIEDHARTVEEGAAVLRRLAEDLSGKQAALEEQERAVSSLKGRIEEIRREMFETMNLAAERRNRHRALEEAIGRNRSERERLGNERSEVREDWTRLDSESRSLDDERAANQEEVERLRRELSEFQEALEQVRNGLAARRTELDSVREKEQSAASRLETLEDLATRFAGHSDGVRLLLGSRESSGLRTHGVIADYVEAGRGIEKAAEAYLQGVLPTVILEDETDARRAADLLSDEEVGRTTFLCRSQPAGAAAVGVPSNGRPPVPDEIMADPRVVGSLQDGLQVKTGTNGTLEGRIGDAVLVDDLEAALDLHRRYAKADYITAAGEVVYASGLVAAGGRKATRHGLLAHNRQVAETRKALEEARAQVEKLERRLQEEREAAERLERSIAGTREALEQAGQRRVELSLRVQRSAEDRERAGRRSEVLESELASSEEEALRLEGELAAAGEEVRGIEETHRRLEAGLESEGSLLSDAEEELRRRSEEASALRAELAAEQRQQESLDREQQRLEELASDLAERIEALRREQAEADSRSTEAAELLRKTEVDLAEHVNARGDRAAELQSMQAGIEERRLGLGQEDKDLQKARTEFESIRERTRDAEVARTRAEADRRHLDDLCFGELGIDAREAAEAAGEALAETDLEEIEPEIGRIREKLERIGPVNMMAIEEYSELEERYNFLSTQKDDLEKAMASLEEMIRKINRTSRERFVTAFESIRQNYREIFTVLFNGGRADLKLEEGEDVLECGIEILAQPPGKRLGSVQLLSGGEKALSAIALLFAIFRHQPSPFCLLDEVDAALDDVNVGRFTRMLREYATQSQFILITHNKVSMESANLLYGITMEEPGVSRVMSLQLH